MKNIYCVVGKSGVGKDTIVNYLCEEYGYKRVVSFTTRKPREDPKDIQSHIFASTDDYYRMSENGNIVAETEIEGNLYWVNKEQLDEADLYIVDPKGLRDLKSQYQNKPIVGIWFHADEDIRKNRMKSRGDTDINIEKRIRADTAVFGDVKGYEFDIFLLNNKNGELKRKCELIDRCIQDKENDKTNIVYMPREFVVFNGCKNFSF